MEETPTDNDMNLPNITPLPERRLSLLEKYKRGLALSDFALAGYLPIPAYLMFSGFSVWLTVSAVVLSVLLVPLLLNESYEYSIHRKMRHWLVPPPKNRH